jgi:hypothetical protein
MRFTGFEAAMLNAVGETNSGKTSMARLMLSMYGNYDVLKLRQQDTYNSKIQRIAALGSLPSYIDEVTNIDPKDLGDMVYEISQGRSKLRLKQDGTERETHEWNTVVVSSSNSPLSGRLGMAKANPEAERMRLFEFRVGRQSRFDGVAGTRLFELLAHNYGHAGQAYLRFVVTHQEEIRRRLIDFGAKFRDYCKGQPEERYWMATITCSLFGLKLMTELGLLNLDVDRVVRFAASAVKRAREQVADAKSTALEMLGHYMNLFASTRITLRQTGETRAGDPQYTMEHTPLHEIHMRLESVPGRCWIDSRHLERWLNTEGEDWGEFCAALRETGVLVRRIRKTLGAGTPFETAQVSTLELNMKVPILGNQNMMLLVADVAAETRRKTEGRDTL